MKTMPILFKVLQSTLFTTALAAAPVNDLFVNRITLTGTNVNVQGSNVGAGEEPGEDIGLYQVRIHTVWYSWTAPTNGVVKLNGTVTNPDFLFVATAFIGNSVSSLTPAPLTPSGNVVVSAGTVLEIQIGSAHDAWWGWGGGVGDFILQLWLDAPEPTSANDAFTNRLEITVPTYSFDGSIYGATNELSEPLPTPTTRQTLWWKLTPTESGLLKLAPFAEQFSPLMRVYQGGQLGSLAIVPPLSELAYQLEAGHEYAIQMAGTSVGAGHFTLSTRFYPASNDMFAGSLKFDVTNATVHGDTIAATFEPNEPNPGGTNTIWFSWAAPQTGRVWFSPGPVWWRPMAVYTGAGVDRLAPVRLVSADNGVFCFLAEQGTVYHFQYAGQSGDFALAAQIEAFPSCANDNFASAQVIKGQNAQDRRSVVGATLEMGEPAHLGTTPAKSIWWKWQAPVSGSISFYTERSLVPNVVLAVYRGGAVEALTLTAKGANQVNFFAIGGETYFLAGAVPGSAIGDVLIYWQYNNTSSGSRTVPGNLLREPSWEGTAVLGAQYWGMSGEIGGYVGEGGGADGVTWPVLGGGGQVWQDIPTAPGRNHSIRFAFSGGGAQVRVSWDDRELGVATIPPDEGSFWHWADFTVYASNTTSRVRFHNLGPMFANVHVDAFSVVPLTAPPLIITQPASASTFSGAAATWLIGATGTAPLAYQWYFGDTLLSGKTNSILTLDPVVPEQAGAYRVVITNAFGSVTSAPATLTVESPLSPIIVLQPYSDTVVAGGYFALSVAAVGTPPLQFQWLCNGAEIAGATNRQIIFAPVDSTNAGTYAAKVWNHSETVWSLPARIQVVPATNTGGAVMLINEMPEGGNTRRALVFDVDGLTPLNGPDYVAQLYAGPTLATIRAVGQPSPFRSGFDAGLIEPEAVPLPTVAPGQDFFAQVRAWQRSKAASYEEARAIGSKFGRSEIIQLSAGIMPEPPPLWGLQSFHLQAGMPQFATGQIQFVERQPADIVVWSHRGEPGFHYVIERSVGGFEWRPFVVVTNVTSMVTFTDSTKSGSAVTYYRSRLLD